MNTAALNMSNLELLTLIILPTALLLFTLIAVVIFVCTHHSSIYKKMKQPVKTEGIIEDAHHVSVSLSPSDSAYEGPDYYQISYSYADNHGQRHTSAFHWTQNIGKAGDKIELYYDAQNPDQCLPVCQLNYGKNLWWKILIFLAALIILTVFIVIKYGD